MLTKNFKLVYLGSHICLCMYKPQTPVFHCYITFSIMITCLWWLPWCRLSSFHPFAVLVSAGSDFVDAVVEAGGLLCSRKGVNLPGRDLIGLQAVSEKDEADLRFGVAHGVDMVFASFIRSAQDVKDVRRALGPHGQDVKVISKVESRQGVDKWVEENTSQLKPFRELFQFQAIGQLMAESLIMRLWQDS